MQVLLAGWYHCKASTAQNILLSPATLIPLGSGAFISKVWIIFQGFLKNFFKQYVSNLFTHCNNLQGKFSCVPTGQINHHLVQDLKWSLNRLHIGRYSDICSAALHIEIDVPWTLDIVLIRSWFGISCRWWMAADILRILWAFHWYCDYERKYWTGQKVF